MKVTIYTKTYYRDGSPHYLWYVCPNCGNDMIVNWDDYCGICKADIVWKPGTGEE